MNPVGVRMMVVLGLMAALLGSCEKEDGNDTPADTQQQLSLSLKHTFNGSLLHADSLYTDSVGTAFAVTTLRYYLSGIALYHADGDTTTVQPDYVLVKGDEAVETVLNLGEITTGNYVGFSFNVGLPAFINQAVTPTDAGIAADSVLATQTDVPMWWNRTRGYKFLVLEGQYDNSQPANGLPDMPFSYQLGTNNLLTKISVARSFTVAADRDLVLAMEVDIARLFDHINLTWQHRTDTHDNRPLADLIQREIPNVFALENF